MAPVVRRAAVVAAPPPVEVDLINFGDLDTYAGGFTLPEGEYALEFDVRMHAGTKADGSPAGEPRLGVMIGAHPLAGGEAIQQFMSMGTNAHKSFAPDPDTGKGVVRVPGGAGANANNKTNWFILLKSLYDCGLPKGIFTNDLTTIDGVWVRTQNIPEPEDRKGFGATAKTGEVQKQEERRSGLIPVVTEILEGGKPWEGGGGFDFAPAPAAVVAPVVRRGPAAVAAPAARVAAAAKPVVARRLAPPPPPPVAAEAEGELTEDDVMVAAVNGAAVVLTKNPKGCPKLTVRTGTFKAVTEAAGPEMASAVIDTLFASDELVDSVISQLGYKVSGTQVVPA